MRTRTVAPFAVGLLSSFLFTSLSAPTQAAPRLHTQTPAAPASVDQAQVEATTRTAEQFVDFVATGEFEKARQLMNPILRDGWSASQMREDWDDLQKVAGAYQKRLDTQWVDSDLVLVNLQFLRLSDNLLILFDEQGQISGVDFPLQLPRL
jgi:Protein of unknown function (DUF3887)